MIVDLTNINTYIIPTVTAILGWAYRVNNTLTAHIAEDKIIHESVSATLLRLERGQEKLIEHLLGDGE